MRLRERGEPDRAGDVAAAAQHGVGAVRSTMPARGADRRARAEHRARRLQRVRARDALDAQRLQLVAGGGHELRLGALSAREDDLGALSPQRVRDCQCRDDVARRPAGGDHDPRRPCSARLSSRDLTARSVTCPPWATLSSSPIAHSSTISELEPEEMNGSGTPVRGARPRTV